MTKKRIQALLSKMDGTPNKNGRIYDPNTIQEQIKKIRKLNEVEMAGSEVGQKNVSKKTVYDQTEEEAKFRKNFDDLNVVVDFKPLEVTNNYILWGGTIDGVVEFVYKVTRNEDTSGVDYTYSDELSGDNPDNQEVVDRIEKYYKTFFKYWKGEIFDK